MKGQIYDWNANVIQFGIDVTDCELPEFYTSGESTFGAMDYANSRGNSIYWGSYNVLIGNNECDWYYGVFRSTPTNPPIISFERIDDLTHSSWNNNNNFLLIGRTQVLGNEENNPPNFPVNSSSEFIYQYNGNDFYFNFPKEHQVNNIFYNFKMNIVSYDNIAEQADMILGVNTDFENPDIPFDEWLQGDPLASKILSKQKVTKSVYNVDNQYISFPFDIPEPPNHVQSYNHQIGLLLQLPPPSDYVILSDRFILECDPKNVVFDFDISVCQLDELNDCQTVRHCLELKTKCENVNFNNFPHRYRFSNEISQYFFEGEGQFTRLDLSSLPFGTYNINVEYYTNTGYNIKVAALGNLYAKTFVHQEINAYNISANTTFDTPVYVPKDIIVLSPAVLTIKDMAYFRDDTKIILETGAGLVVEGLGHLTACESRWDGVIAKGHSNVVIRNNGTISFAKTGIYIPGVNGLTSVTLNRAHFINNIIGLHGKQNAAPLIELSYFTEGQTGVLLDNVIGGTAQNGVYFRGNEFAFMSKEGILSYNTPIQVEDGNEFSYCYDGIALRNLFASNEQSFIGLEVVLNNEEYNYFENTQNAVYTNGSDVNIENNIFANNIFGGFYSGISSVETIRNNFSGTNGERYAGTGSNTSYSQFNEYQTATGITLQYDNTRYTFLSNCFQTGAWDVLATGGNIALAQGNSTVAASNCFTGSSVPDFVCGTPDKVLYFTPDPMVAHPVCLDPVFVSNYEVKDFATTFNSGECGTSLLPPSPGEYSYIRSLGCNITLLSNHITFLKGQINALLSQQQPLSDLDKANLSWLSRHLRYTQQRLARCLRKQGLKQELYNFYKAQQERDFDISAAGVLFDMGLTSDAILSLDTVWNTHGGDSQILQALKLNLLYRDSLNQLPLNNTDIAVLQTVSAMSDPYATYARALLYKINGQRTEPDTSIVMPRTRHIANFKISEKYYSLPNPAQDHIFIKIENYQKDAEYRFQMYDMIGQFVNGGSLNEKTEIPVVSLPDGVYFIQIYKNGIQQKTIKNLILH